jgi:PKD repeat protein
MKMPSMNFLNRLAARAAVSSLALGLVACTLDKQAAPSLSGPSEFGLSVTMAASPDQLPRDGTSQSIVTLTVRDSQGRAVSGQRVSLSLPANAPVGATLSQSEVVTGSGGQATFAVTAPASGSLGNILVAATPVGTTGGNVAARTISITATPTNGTAPAAAFAFSPATPEVGELVTLDASTTRDEGVPCGTCSYAWNFGGEGTASGMIVKHAFGAGGAYLVTLTVTDVGGSTSSTQQTITVSAPGPATVAFSVVPAQPIAAQTATFTSVTTPATNHRIVSYVWSWGDGSSSQSTAAASIQHTFDQAGTYPVTLTVRDDLGQSANVTNAVVVTSGLLAVLTQSPASPVAVGQTVFFDGSGSSSSTGTRITNYLFDFGDGASQSSAFPTAKHEYAATGAYIVKLTITDERGRTASTTSVGAGAAAGSGNITVQ